MIHSDDSACDKSYQYGSSPRNSRIESWWSRLRTHKTEWWIQHFRTLERDGWFVPGSILHRNCMVFVFLPLLTKELNDFVALWNSHHIRPVRLSACPSGRPDDMYDMPQIFGGINGVVPISEEIFQYAIQNLAQSPPAFYSRHFYDVCSDVVRLSLIQKYPQIYLQHYAQTFTNILSTTCDFMTCCLQ